LVWAGFHFGNKAVEPTTPIGAHRRENAVQALGVLSLDRRHVDWHLARRPHRVLKEGAWSVPSFGWDKPGSEC